eukprot:m.145366 g.145366  ORF g.145366 m.145366 type:complete len:236 (-) comp17733_c0_seq1:418-1125(-)
MATFFFSLLFFASATAYTALCIQQAYFPDDGYVQPPHLWGVALKALPASSLLLDTLSSGRHGRITATCGALLFSLWGDIALEMEVYTDLSFLLGLGSFAIAHLFFIRAFLFHGYAFTVPRTLLVLTELGLGMFVLGPLFAQNAPEELALPVLIYTTIIAGMLVAATVGVAHTATATVGAVLFAVSDAIIGIDEFLYRSKHHNVAIISLYYTAQWLLVSGMRAADADTAAPPKKTQ